MRTAIDLREAASAQVPMADYLPPRTHMTAEVIKLQPTGALMTTWRLEGISFETADPKQILQHKEGLCNLLHSLRGGRFAVWTHRIRRQVRERLTAEYDHPFAQQLLGEYNARLDKDRQMVTELYMTLVYNPRPSRAERWFKRLGKRTEGTIRAQDQADLAALDDMAKRVEAGLKRYGPERLGTRRKGQVVVSEVLSFLGYLCNGMWEDVPLKRANIAEYLPTSRLNFSDSDGLLELWHPKAKKFAAFLDLQDYPPASEPGMMNGILYGDFEFIETQSFSILHKRDANAALERQAGQLASSETATADELAQMGSAIDALKDGRIEMGEYHYTLAVFGQSVDDAIDHRNAARSRLEDDAGFKAAVIDAVPECAWFAQLPGNWSMRPREASISSANFASLSPFHGFTRGKRDGNPWGEAVALLSTVSGQPLYFNWHASPDDDDSSDEKYPGNTFVCGATGVGKTTVATALLTFSMKYQGLRAMVFDKDRGMELWVRRMGGKYHALRRGEPTGFNPLQLPATEANIQFVEQLVRMLVGPTTDPKDKAIEDKQISHAVRTSMLETTTPELRCLSAVHQALAIDGLALGLRLEKWLRGQPLGWVFDNPFDAQDLTTHRLYGYDYTEFLNERELCGPVMAYLMHLADSMIDGRPFIYYVTEFWQAMSDPYFTEYVRNKQKTIRKQSGLGVFDTQQPDDVLTQAIGKTMVQQCVTKIYLPNPDADRTDYVDGFKLTESEFKLLRSFAPDSRLMLIKQGHRSTVARFDLGGMIEVLTVLSGSLDNVELMDAIRAEVGDDPEVCFPILHQRVAERRARIRAKRA